MLEERNRPTKCLQCWSQSGRVRNERVYMIAVSLSLSRHTEDLTMCLSACSRAAPSEALPCQGGISSISAVSCQGGMSSISVAASSASLVEVARARGPKPYSKRLRPTLVSTTVLLPRKRLNFNPARLRGMFGCSLSSMARAPLSHNRQVSLAIGLRSDTAAATDVCVCVCVCVCACACACSCVRACARVAFPRAACSE